MFDLMCAGLLSQGYSTPFLSIGSTYMYTSLSVAKQAVLAVGEELKSSGLPPEICPLVFVFTGTGNGIPLQTAPVISKCMRSYASLLSRVYVSECNSLFYGGCLNDCKGASWCSWYCELFTHFLSFARQQVVKPKNEMVYFFANTHVLMILCVLAVSNGAQEILNLLPHEYVHPSRLHELTDTSSSKVR